MLPDGWYIQVCGLGQLRSKYASRTRHAIRERVNMTIEDDSTKNETKPLGLGKKILIEPAPLTPRGGRVRVNDGLDNSDLRMLLSLAAEKAKQKKE
jgi:hypothetical protein